MRVRFKRIFPLLIGSLFMAAALAACGGTGAKPIDSVASSEVDADAIAAAGYIPSIRAIDHVGETGTVKGLIRDYQYHDGKPGKPTLLLFDEAGLLTRGSSVSDMETPDTFSIVVMRKDKPNFPAHYAQNWSGQIVCVTGTIEMYFDKPVMIVSDAANISVDC